MNTKKENLGGLAEIYLQEYLENEKENVCISIFEKLKVEIEKRVQSKISIFSYQIDKSNCIINRLRCL